MIHCKKNLFFHDRSSCTLPSLENQNVNDLWRQTLGDDGSRKPQRKATRVELTFYQGKRLGIGSWRVGRYEDEDSATNWMSQASPFATKSCENGAAWKKSRYGFWAWTECNATPRQSIYVPGKTFLIRWCNGSLVSDDRGCIETRDWITCQIDLAGRVSKEIRVGSSFELLYLVFSSLRSSSRTTDLRYTRSSSDQLQEPGSCRIATFWRKTFFNVWFFLNTVVEMFNN